MKFNFEIKNVEIQIGENKVKVESVTIATDTPVEEALALYKIYPEVLQTIVKLSADSQKSNITN